MPLTVVEMTWNDILPHDMKLWILNEMMTQLMCHPTINDGENEWHSQKLSFLLISNFVTKSNLTLLDGDSTLEKHEEGWKWCMETQQTKYKYHHGDIMSLCYMSILTLLPIMLIRHDV